MLNLLSNFPANKALSNLTINSGEATKSVARLSSGSRLANPGDDVASLAIGSRLKAEVASLGQAVVNAGQASSLLQVADGALARTQDILNRLKALSVQAGNPALGSSERALLDVEFQNLISEVDRIANDTKFGGKSLLANANGNLIAVNTGANGPTQQASGMFDMQSHNAGSMTAGAINGIIRNFDNNNTNAGGDGAHTIQVVGAYSADSAGDQVLNFQASVSGEAGSAGYTTFVDKSLIENAGTATADLLTGITLTFGPGNVGAGSTLNQFSQDNGQIVVSLDETANVTAGTANGIGSVSGAVNLNSVNTGLSDADKQAAQATNEFSFKVGSGILPTEDAIQMNLSGITAENMGIANAGIDTASRADSASQAIDQAIDFVVSVRAEVGSSFNRVEFASRNLATTIENTEAARSTLMDLDVAQEVTKFTSQQILIQAGISTLAQANQLPQNLLRLFA